MLAIRKLNFLSKDSVTVHTNNFKIHVNKILNKIHIKR